MSNNFYIIIPSSRINSITPRFIVPTGMLYQQYVNIRTFLLSSTSNLLSFEYKRDLDYSPSILVISSFLY